ncbi:1-aminocyclopropane-1-carboxylate deaminase/D-cysteine desulfhydrase [Aurantibacter crassamenti]|uniref:1-aminocyclopropane-1-carboxylate deaminase/D-cysteine desulfhydrase n=1 Tax=Aurantibacter crassamenti TaxID=1837375 RepID=UPI00193A8BE9|nr:pyridoxal-phosphate dependent enzyme [Aurantibacter crassamenti]MBM1105911.1 1-aminocyclopropane-1-carboxylate deaminase/D-cysteine desulfhydrase [Aurantibacter crassamenti]
MQHQEIQLPILKEKNVSLFIKREDLLHPIISGNKFRKLKYNLQEAKRRGHTQLLTFGGAFSNHIAATACAGRENDLKTIGIIRGEELRDDFLNNPTLKLAHEMGMQFKFISRKDYRNKADSSFLVELKNEFGEFYGLPEGGTNPLAVKGCEEILEAKDSCYNVVCCPVGTGGTIAGVINASLNEQFVLGFSALKGDFLKEDIRKFAVKKNWNLVSEYHFGGYAKVTEELVQFINDFKLKTNISLDPIYTGKMVYGILDMIQKNHFKPGTQILAIHTGGLQGIAGMNLMLEKKNKTLIAI